MNNKDSIIQTPNGYDIFISWGRETIRFRMQHMAQAVFVLQQAQDRQSRLNQLMRWFDDASFEEIEMSKDAVEFVCDEHDAEQEPNPEIPSPIPAIIRQVREHFWDRALNAKISEWERRLER